MNIPSAAKGLGKLRVFGQMGKNHQLDLTVVSGDKKIPFGRNKGRADPSAVLIPDGDILEIGILTGKTPGSGPGLDQLGMNPASFRVNQFGQGVDIG